MGSLLISIFKPSVHASIYLSTKKPTKNTLTSFNKEPNVQLGDPNHSYLITAQPILQCFFSPPFVQDTCDREAAEAPPPETLVRGAPATSWRQDVLPTASRSLWALPLSLTRAERERRGEGERESICRDVRQRGEGERVRQRKQTRQRLQCVSGQRGVSECSPPLFSRVKTPGGLSAPGSVIYHQLGEAGPPLWPMQLTHIDRWKREGACACTCTHARTRRNL